MVIVVESCPDRLQRDLKRRGKDRAIRAAPCCPVGDLHPGIVLNRVRKFSQTVDLAIRRPCPSMESHLIIVVADRHGQCDDDG